jgi:hypothetical protein
LHAIAMLIGSPPAELAIAMHPLAGRIPKIRSRSLRRSSSGIALFRLAAIWSAQPVAVQRRQ